MPRQTSVQLTEATERQAAELKAQGFGSMTDVIRTAIDRMYHQEKGRSMNAKQQVAELLKTIYDAGDVNAMTIWKGYDAHTTQTGWHYKWFGRSDAQYMGKSVAEVREYVDEAAATFRAQYVEAVAKTADTPKYFIPGNSTAALMLNRSGDIGEIVGDYSGDTYLVKFPDSDEEEQWSYADGYTANTRKEAQVIADSYLHYQSEE